MDALMRYPRVSQITFWNAAATAAPMPDPIRQISQPADSRASVVQRMTGIQLGPLLDEAGVKPEGKWMIAKAATRRV